MGECVLSVSDQAALCPPGFRDEIRQILKYTTYRAISESDDAKGQNRSLSIIDSSASKSRSSSSSSGSGSLIVRSCVKYNWDSETSAGNYISDSEGNGQHFDWIWIDGASDAFADWVTRSPVLLFLAWRYHNCETAICVMFSEEKIQDMESISAGTGTKRVVNQTGHTMCDSDAQRGDAVGSATWFWVWVVESQEITTQQFVLQVHMLDCKADSQSGHGQWDHHQYQSIWRN